MTEPHEITRLELLVDRDAEPIEGVLVAEHNQWPFFGWTGLAGALESARAAADGDGARPRP